MEITGLTIEVHFTPLPPRESEERTERLRTLLLRAALRMARLDQEVESPANETLQK